MASPPIMTVLEESQVSPPPAATICDRPLPLTFMDMVWLLESPVHYVFFYELPLISKTQFTETIVPNLKRSLSVTLQHFFPYAGNLIVFPTSTRKPELRYEQGDSVKITVSECNLDFNDLTGNHPRNCDKFYHLIPLLGRCAKVSDYTKIPVFSVQVTLFQSHGFSIGLSIHHSIGDASSQFDFLKAWAMVSQCGTDESLLATGTLPFYDRVIKTPKLDETILKRTKVETLDEGYQFPSLSGPTDKVRATFVLTRAMTNRLKKWVSTKLPELEYVSSLTVACAYIWTCIAKSRNDDLHLFGIPIDCRARMDPPIPAAYFGNCLCGSIVIAKVGLLTGKEGFLTAAKLIGENLHKVLTDKDGIMNDTKPLQDLFSDGMPTTMIGVSGTPKLKFNNIDFGWGNPKKLETVSIDYTGSISVNACKELNDDLEIGVCLSATEMQAFIPIFNDGLEANI